MIFALKCVVTFLMVSNVNGRGVNGGFSCAGNIFWACTSCHGCMTVMNDNCSKDIVWNCNLSLKLHQRSRKEIWSHFFVCWMMNLYLFFKEEITEIKARAPENVSCVQVLVKMVSVAWKLSTIKWCQDLSCLFWQGDYRKKGHNPEKLPWIWFLVKMLDLGMMILFLWFSVICIGLSGLC